MKALIKECKGIKPQFSESCFIAENATMIGDIVLGERVGVWYNVVIRGDVNSIRIGRDTNLQDGTIVHCSLGRSKTIIGKNVSVGHNAIIHGCIIHDNCLIGMGAIVMDNAIVEENVIVGAGSLVLENSVLESGYLYAGSPVRKIKKLTDNQREVLLENASNYVEYASWMKKK